MYLTLPPSIMIRKPWGIVSVKRGVARKSCIFTKNVNFAYIKHTLYTDIFAFYKFEDKNNVISNVLGLAPFNQDQNTMGYCFNKTGVARKSCLFTLNGNFAKALIAKYMHFREKSSVFYEFEDKYISFLHVLNPSLNYDQKTLGYRFSEWWCCQKIMPFYQNINSA